MSLQRRSLLSSSCRPTWGIAGRALMLAAACVAVNCHCSAVAEPPQDSLDKDYSGELPRIPPVSPAGALKKFHVEPGFRIEQVAAEPLVTDPTALAFDERGRLFVVEMRGYSEDREKDLGRIRLLEDTDGDGRFDRSFIYVDGLRWPTAVACYDGGVFVGAAPDILFCKDTDGDNRADVREVVYTGFGLGNVQGLLNSFKWGLDCRIHGAASSSGGSVRRPDELNSESLSLRGQDFALDPRSLEMAATSGGAQHGLSFDRWGNKFLCSNSNHIQLVMFDNRYVARNPYLKTPNPRASIAADGPQADVFRKSPVEPWRIVRTRLRVSGLVRGPVEGGGKASGYFTAATGVTIYRGHLFPPPYHGNAFVGDCGSNLIHRKLLEPDGIGQIARRATPGREFVASGDIWFRPVQFEVGPDGALYVCDMAREVVEHPKSLPPLIKKHLDLTSGRDRGRIYRVVPEKFQQPKPVRLDRATSEQLVHTLEHRNGWHRDTALRLLYERRGRSLIGPLEKLASSSKLPEGRMYALYALAGIEALSPAAVLPRLQDEHPRVREHALRLAERLAARSPEVRQAMYRLVGDDDLTVRYQLAFSLGEVPQQSRIEPLAAIARRDAGNPWIRLALQSSLRDGAGSMLQMLVGDGEFRASSGGRILLESLARQIGAQRQADDVAALIVVLQELPEQEKDLAQMLVRGAAQGAGSESAALVAKLTAATSGKASALLHELVENAKTKAFQDGVSVEQRVAAVGSLGVGSYDQVKDTLAQLINPRHPQQVQLAALATFGQFDRPEVAELIIKRFATLSPRLRSEALETIFSRGPWLSQLLNALEEGAFQRSDVEPARIRMLRNHPDSEVRRRAEKALGRQIDADRGRILAAYRSALELSGDAGRGRDHFRKTCAACHRLENHGHEIGKDLTTIRDRGAATILTNVLDPNREVDPKYVNYVALTTDGRQFSGIIESETATSVTLKRAENARTTLLRKDIEELRSTGVSIMPEGLEKKLDQQAMADVIAYLLSLN